jgi:hypothetical protein
MARLVRTGIGFHFWIICNKLAAMAREPRNLATGIGNMGLALPINLLGILQ